jgi:hypothetical protein
MAAMFRLSEIQEHAMSTSGSPKDVNDEAILLMLKSQETRIAQLETETNKTLFKRLTASASASALFLGLVLTFASLYDAFVTKPETNHVSRITQFNDAVNSAAKLRQDTAIASWTTITDPLKQAALVQIVTPQILTNVSTARAVLPYLTDNDIGIPQLMTLITESYTAGDFDGMKVFVERAVNLKNVTPYMHSEAKRFEARYFFIMGDPAKGRQSFKDELLALGESDATTYNRAFAIGEETYSEFLYGDCSEAFTDVSNFIAILPRLQPQYRSTLAVGLRDQLRAAQSQHCTAPEPILSSLAQ